MSLTTEGMTPADLVAVTGNRNNGMFGDNGWWIILLFLFVFGGFGNGWGNNAGAQDNYVLASDFATLQRQLSDGFGGVEKGIDTIRNGLCDGFYTEAQLINGVNMNIQQNGYETRLATQNLGSQMASCCCDLRAGIQANTTQGIMNTNDITRQISDVKYQMATDTCALGNQMQNSARDITDNANANTKAILDFLVNDKMSNLQRENDALRLAASQQAQNNYLIGQLRPAPVPAYNVANPYASCGCGCGCS